MSTILSMLTAASHIGLLKKKLEILGAPIAARVAFSDMLNIDDVRPIMLREGQLALIQLYVPGPHFVALACYQLPNGSVKVYYHDSGSNDLAVVRAKYADYGIEEKLAAIFPEQSLDINISNSFPQNDGTPFCGLCSTHFLTEALSEFQRKGSLERLDIDSSNAFTLYPALELLKAYSGNTCHIVEPEDLTPQVVPVFGSERTVTFTPSPQQFVYHAAIAELHKQGITEVAELQRIITLHTEVAREYLRAEKALKTKLIPSVTDYQCFGKLLNGELPHLLDSGHDNYAEFMELVSLRSFVVELQEQISQEIIALTDARLIHQQERDSRPAMLFAAPAAAEDADEAFARRMQEELDQADAAARRDQEAADAAFAATFAS